MSEKGATKIKVLFFPYWPDNPYQTNLMNALKVQGAIVEGVKDTSFETLAEAARGQDVLHLHWSHPYLIGSKLNTSFEMAYQFFRFLILQKLKGQKLVWTIHNLGEHDKRQPGIELTFHKLLARLVDGIIVHSYYSKIKTIETFKISSITSKIHVIHHGNYINNYPNVISREEAREMLEIETNKKVFLFLGQIRSYKGLPELISAFSNIYKGNEVLILAGKAYNESISEEVRNIIGAKKGVLFYPGFIEDEKIQVYMRASDAVVFPFRDIFTSGSILLAMSFGKAIITPDLESLEEITRLGGTITYEREKNESLEAALLKATSMNLEPLGACNLAAAKTYSWESISKKTADLYKIITL